MDIEQGRSIGIIGNGSWGTAIAKILTDNGNCVHWWIRNQDAVSHLSRRLHNPHYLTSVRFLQGTILPTNDLAAMLEACDTLIMAVPSAYAQGVINSVQPECWKGKIIISAIKGILPECNMLLNDYLAAEYQFPIEQYLAITGPCHAEEVAEERLSYLTFSGLNDTLTAATASIFNNNYIHTTTNHDAIGSGIARALDYGDNFLSVYITNCYREMFHFLTAHFNEVNPLEYMPDFHTSAYLGDLLVTCYSLHSRNRTFGTMIGKGYTVKAAQLEMNMVAEGYFGARGLHNISCKFEAETPIAATVYRILWENLPAAQGFTELERLLS